MVSILLAEQNPKKKDERGIHFWKNMDISSLHYATSELMFFLFPKWDVSSLKGMAKPKHQGPIKLMPKHLGRPARRHRLQIGPEVADSVNVGFNAIILNSP